MIPLELPPIVTVSELRRLGESPAGWQRSARSGLAIRVRRAVYLPTPTWDGLNADARHITSMIAAQKTARTPLVFSHESAAVALGIPLIGRMPAFPQVSASPELGRRTRHGIQWHAALLGEDDIRLHDGFIVTSPLRTIVDMLACRSFLSGVASLDHVLRELETYGLTKQLILDELQRRRPFRNVRRADAATEFAGGISESVLESMSMVFFDEFGYPRPQQQREYRGHNGAKYSVDFYWKDSDTIGEADGEFKYTDPRFLRGRTPEQALRDEKIREDELRAQCRTFVRWGWDDVWGKTGLVQKLERAGVRRTGVPRAR